MDNDTFNPAHSTVPLGHVTLSAPFDPVGPCGPVDPDISKFGFVTAACSHANCVTLVPDVPAGGVVPTDDANDAVIAVTEVDEGTLAVVADNAYPILCI